MDDLPDLPFEQLLSYLDLKDLVRSRAVSKRWLAKIDSLRLHSLLYSGYADSGHLLEKRRLVTGQFIQNYMRPSRLEPFFGNLAAPMLRALRHLRVCDLTISNSFVQAVNSFGQLESLDIIRPGLVKWSEENDFKLVLPNLKSIRLEEMKTVQLLVLDTPKLLQIVIRALRGFRLVVVAAGSVERVAIYSDLLLDLVKFENLKILHCKQFYRYADRILTTLKQLEELHFSEPQRILSDLYDQKNRLNRSNLKIFYHGLCFDSFRDYAFLPDWSGLSEALLIRMAMHPARLADEIPFYEHINYSEIERAILRVANKLVCGSLWSKFSNLKRMMVDKEVLDVQQFLDFLKCLSNLVELQFHTFQPQRLFDQLHRGCTNLQRLEIGCLYPDLEFLFEHKHLLSLSVQKVIDGEFIRRCFEQLRWLRYFSFSLNHKYYTISTDERGQFIVSSGITRSYTCQHLDDLVLFVNSQAFG